MKKAIVAVMAVLMVVLLAGCGSSQKLQNAYDSIGSMSFSDESILTNAEQSALRDMKERREQYFKNKKTKDLLALKDEWDSFKRPINDYIARYEQARGTFFEDSDRALLTAEELQSCNELEKAITDAYKDRNEDTLSDAIDEWDTYSADLREVIQTYHEIDQSPFSDTELELLSADMKSEMQTLAESTETALVSRDISSIKSLAGEWSSFTQKASGEIDAAKDKLIKDWMASADISSSVVNLFSFGMVTQTNSLNGHKITYTTQYNTDLNASDEQIKKAMDSYLEFTSSLFQSGVNDLKKYVDDFCIRIEYRNKNGNVVSYREFN